MPNTLKSENFGLQLYNRFPPKYREDDSMNDLSLKRYLQSLADGGFKHSIDEINGITTLIDPDKVDSSVIPILFQQYGLEVFNGIPENYLRYLLPKLGEAWSKKGSISVVEFVTSSLSGVKTSTNINYDNDGNPLISIKLEMDYNIGDYFPEVEHLNRILKNFVPFYCDVLMYYSYVFYENAVLYVKEKEILSIKENKDEKASIPGVYNIVSYEPILNNVLRTLNYNFELNDMVGTGDLEVDYHKDTLILNQTEIGDLQSEYEDTYKIGSVPINEDGNMKSKEIADDSFSLMLNDSATMRTRKDDTEEELDTFEDQAIVISKEVGVIQPPREKSLTNSLSNVLNKSFFTNTYSCFDIITKAGKTEVVFN